jgi:isochorismate pyruvate lyase
MTFEPDMCQTMADVRAGVDSTDAALVALLGRRFGYMRAAARIKTDIDQVRDEARKAQVIGNAKSLARAHAVPEALVAALWEMLVESSIAYEAETLRARTSKPRL